MYVHDMTTSTNVAILVCLADCEFPQQQVKAEKQIAATKDMMVALRAHPRHIFL